MNILDELVAKGVSGEVIVAVAKLIADAEQTQERRTKNTERMRSVRAHAHTHAHTETQKSALSLEVSKKELTKEVRKKETKKKIPLPPDWQPNGSQRDPTEPDEFRDHARAKGYQYADWDAAYRNFQKSPFNARNKPGAAFAPARPAMTDAEQRAYVEKERQRILREATENGKTEATGLWRDTDVGNGRQCQSRQLRLAGGILHEDAERRRADGNALLAATALALRR